MQRATRSPCGSSPPARGTPHSAWRPPTQTRFIPACAGNTRPWRSSSNTPTVHPRLRGEHPMPPSNTTLAFGSSPPARGTRHDWTRTSNHSRFIPACAGNTATQSISTRSATVHPRLRGEHIRSNSSSRNGGGSSPPARGTPARGFPLELLRRFIPACAGNTSSPSRRLGTSAVHPRLRGEHVDDDVLINAVGGSSPPARGTPAAPRSDR